MKDVLKKILKWGLIVFSVVLIIFILLVIWQWDVIQVMTGNADVPEDISAVPEQQPETEIPPLTEGESDWLHWRGSNGDGKSGMKDIITDWGAGLEKKWEIDYLCRGKASAVWSSPVVKGNRLVVAGREDENDSVYCLNPDTGSLIWKASYDARAGSSYGKGSRATPWIEKDRVYTFGRSGDLVCWNLENGDKIWHKNVNAEGGKEATWGHSTSPFILDDIIIVNGGGNARTIAYNKKTGELKWKSGSGPEGYAAITSMKIEGKEVLLSFHGKGLAAMNPQDGSLLWDSPWETSYDVNASTPVFADNLVFISSGYGTGGQVLKVSLTGAEVMWKNKAIAAHHTDPFIVDGYIYGYSGDSMQNGGTFKCLDLKTGEEKWSTNDMGWGTCIWIEGYLLCMDIKGNLFLMKPDPAAFTLVTSMSQALGNVKGAAWTIPVAANGNLFLRLKNKLVCYRLKM